MACANGNDVTHKTKSNDQNTHQNIFLTKKKNAKKNIEKNT